jgi:glyoxylase I family protein
VTPTGIDHVVLRVLDLERAVGFYQQVLGCAVERRKDALGMVQMRAGDALIDLIAIDGKLGRAGGAGPGREGRNMDHLCLAVENFDLVSVRAHLERHHVEMGEVGERHGASGLSTSIYLTDPDGNGLELRGRGSRTGETR